MGLCPTILREIAALQSIPPHPNVVRLLGLLHNSSSMSVDLVLEYIGDVTLASQLSRGPLPPLRVRQLAYHLLRGIGHIHRHGIMHRDLKPQNLLLRDVDRSLVICDFGSSRLLPFRAGEEFLTVGLMTYWYRAPEVLLHQAAYDGGVDMWSAGCVIGELMCGYPLFPGECEADQLLRVCQVVGTPAFARTKESNLPHWNAVGKLTEAFPEVEIHNATAESLLRGLLCVESSSRISAAEALRHPYFTGMTTA